MRSAGGWILLGLALALGAAATSGELPAIASHFRAWWGRVTGGAVVADSDGGGPAGPAQSGPPVGGSDYASAPATGYVLVPVGAIYSDGGHLLAMRSAAGRP